MVKSVETRLATERLLRPPSAPRAENHAGLLNSAGRRSTLYQHNFAAAKHDVSLQ